MSRTLPALIAHPLPAATPPPDPAVREVRQELTAGLPVRIDLDAARAL
ncbi:hypothetical protein GTY80_17300, partial [Amycolatopsis sp. SID8362]|nr:hypothetical protein [Amycolatopsis sp. SID8362]NED41696.1 hypothetical protein [Amycolatopsis sp. SID8362]